MVALSPQECRVLGVLLEKAFTTPAQYPISLNGLTTGCNQKSNREPVVSYEEIEVSDTINSLRGKGLALVVDTVGSRVAKFKHNAREGLGVGSNELAVLAELMMRGPQTLGELRTRCSRMRPLESLDIVRNILAELMEGDEPMVRRLSPAPGSRAERYAQLLCPDLHPIDQVVGPEDSSSSSVTQAVASQDSDLAQRVEQLESEVAELKNMVHRLAMNATPSGVGASSGDAR